MVDEAKSRTQVAQLTTAAVVLVVLLFLTKPLQYLPNAVLSAVVFLIGVKLVDLARMREIWRLRKDEFTVAAVTTVVVVCVGVEQGIVLAIVLSLVLHVRRHYTPQDAVIVWDARGRISLVPPEPGAVSEPGLVVYRFAVGLFYANAERFGDEVRGLVEGAEPPRWLVLDLGAVDDIDFTGGETLLELVEELQARNIVVAVAGPGASLQHELDSFGIAERIGREHIYATVEDAREAFRQK
jgi:MFS superfamily sulfate permease-like transporter